MLNPVFTENFPKIKDFKMHIENSHSITDKMTHNNIKTYSNNVTEGRKKIKCT